MAANRILITGGAGYIGSHVAHMFVQRGYDVTVLDNLYSGFRWAVPSAADFVEGSVGDRLTVAKILRGKKIEAVLHFAAHIEVEESVLNPSKYYTNNTIGTLNLLSTCAEVGVDKIIFSSTAAVYGDPTMGVVNEESPLKPINPYGHSKWMSERMLKDLGETGAFRYVALRYFNVAGAMPTLEIGQSTPRATHLVKVAAQTALGLRSQMAIFGADYATHDGTCVRDYIHVCDLAQAHHDALKYIDDGGESDTFNVGYGHGYSVKDVVTAMRRVSGVEFPAVVNPRRPGDPARLVADSSKACQHLGWKPQYDDLDFICKTALGWEKSLQSRSASSTNQI